MNINEDKLNDLLGKFVGDLGATMHAGSIVIGEKLGLYKAMATPGERVTAAELASRTGTNERYVREWLNANAAGGYVEYDPDADAYYMTDEQAFVMTSEDNPAYLPGAFVLATAALRSVPKMVDRFKTGDGLGWHEHDADLFCGTELFFRPGYIANLVSNWIPALDGARIGAGDPGGRRPGRLGVRPRLRLHVHADLHDRWLAGHPATQPLWEGRVAAAIRRQAYPARRRFRRAPAPPAASPCPAPHRRSGRAAPRPRGNPARAPGCPIRRPNAGRSAKRAGRSAPGDRRRGGRW